MVRNSGSDHSDHAVTETDPEIIHLKTQLQAYQARTSLLQQQQLATLDALDQLQRRQRDDLEEEFRAQRKLQERLWILRRKVREVEAEKDDLQDAVLELVHSVEANHNDLTPWLPSRLHVSSCLPSNEQRHLLNTTQVPKDLDNQQLSYAGSIIRALTHDLHLERQAHAVTRARIHLLEAQIASRDAQIEAWIQSPESWIPGPPATTRSTSSHRSRSRKRNERLTLDRRRSLEEKEVSGVLDRSIQNNRILELEVRNLEMTLEEARLNANASIVSPSSRLRSPSPTVTSRARSRSIRGYAPASRITSPSSPLILRQELPTPINLQPESSNVDTPLQTPTSTLTHYPAPGTSNVSRKLRSPGSSSPAPPQRESSAARLLQSLERQVHALSGQVDAFRDEREALLRVVAERKRDTDESARGGHGHRVHGGTQTAMNTAQAPPLVGINSGALHQVLSGSEPEPGLEREREREQNPPHVDRSVQTSEPERDPDHHRGRRHHRLQHTSRTPGDQHDHPRLDVVERTASVDEPNRKGLLRADVYHDLERQVLELAVQIDAFQDERANLWHVIEGEREHTHEADDRVGEGGSHEGRLPEGIYELGGGLVVGEVTAAWARTDVGGPREKHILAVHDEHASSGQVLAGDVPAEETTEKEVSEEGERSMDLETPVFAPVIMLPVVTDSNPNLSPPPAPSPRPSEIHPHPKSPASPRSRSRSWSRRRRVHSPHPRARHQLPRHNSGRGALSDPGPRVLSSDEDEDKPNEVGYVDGGLQIRMIPPRIPPISRSRSPSPTWP